MLTGRVVTVDESERWGILHYVTPPEQQLEKAKEIAHRIAQNAPLTNYAICNALPRIQDMSYNDGLWFELVVAQYVRGPETSERLAAFLDKSAQRVRPADVSDRGPTAL